MVRHLPIVASDHQPLLLHTCSFLLARLNRPFRFQATWLTHGDFKHFVAQNCKASHSFTNSLDFSNLLLDVTNDEIWVALHNMQPWKAHGVDGLYVGFCQTKWQVVGPIVC
uniref:Reverse transcriptase zinc-binding domain-containing protein n=1 Tax=Manihot esculenta TaxID=3983 RepID=A0A2C9V5B2_MANES